MTVGSGQTKFKSSISRCDGNCDSVLHTEKCCQRPTMPTKKGLRQETVHCQVGFNSEIDEQALSHVQVRESRYWRRMWTACLNVIDFFWAATRNCLLYMFRGATTLWH